MSGSASPHVLLSRSALEDNAQRLLREGGTVDLRHDAFGHGLAEVAPIVRDAGASALLVDARRDADRLAAAVGIPVLLDGEAEVDAHALFGIPDGESSSAPVMQLQGRVLSTKPLLAGEAVSYGYTHRAQRDTQVALVTGGYAQGILRALGNRAHVQIGDGSHPIVGRIAMDVCVVDLQGADAAAGSPVIYFGGVGAMRDALRHWSAITGLTAIEMAVVIGRHGERRWVA